MRKGEVFVTVILGFACAICILVLNDAFKDDAHFLEAMVLGVLGGGLIGALSLLSIHTFGFLAESMKKKFLAAAVVLGVGFAAYGVFSWKLSEVKEFVCVPIVVGIVISIIALLVLSIAGIIYRKVSGRGDAS